MPRYAPNKASLETKRLFFELIRQGSSGLAASLAVGVSPSCGSLWFIDADRVSFIERPISRRYLTQDDRIEIAEGLAAGEPVTSIAARIGKSFQSVYREIKRNSKPDGRYQSWFAHNQAYLRRRRAKHGAAAWICDICHRSMEQPPRPVRAGPRLGSFP
jgi:transposase, IS30 family